MKKIINGTEYEIAPCANLHGVNLCGASLNGADLRDASLNGADLHGANLRDANLRDANLRDAELHGAELHGADLRSASLDGANLRYANLRGADLRGAYLCGADLRGAKLHGADLRNATLDGANLPPLIVAQLSIVAEGEIVGYKKLSDGTICKLQIPAGAKRSNATGRKCRAEYAIVLEGEGASSHDPGFRYKAGATVRPVEPFCENRWEECASGIHFYLTREEAENHQ